MAVVAQQWEQPYFLVAPETKIADFIESHSKPHLDFTYWPWGEPEQVVDALKNGQPLPDRLSVPIAEPDPIQTAARVKDQNIRVMLALGLIIFGILCLILIFS
ncbi:MAG: hypothetical protein EOO88_43625 [Pedobacter sp.]|nr:MAG: hypothetical protein EOO88_43625 [Pedobacter sp.]